MAGKPSVFLAYGNQRHQVEQATDRWIAEVLGDAPLDFALQRFDATDLVRGGASSPGAQEGLERFEAACITVPFLCERYVVRLDRLEAVRPGERGAQNLQRQIDGIALVSCRVGGQPAWAPRGELPTGAEPGGSSRPLGYWVIEVMTRAGTPPVLHLRPEDPPPRFVLEDEAEPRLVELPTFLSARLQGRFTVSGGSPAETAAGSAPSTNAGRLHRVLERLLAQPPPGLYLALTATAERDSNVPRGLLTTIGKQGRVEKFITYDDYSPVDWVLSAAEQRGAVMNRGLAVLLIELAGNDHGRLATELDKLALLASGAPLTEETLLSAVHGQHAGSLFRLNDLLGEKNLSGALSVLEHFLAETPHEHPLLLGVLARHFRQLYRLHELQAQGVAESDWPGRLKLHPFLTRRLAGQARRFQMQELERVLRTLAKLDVALKLRSRVQGPLLREFLQELCAGAFARARSPLLHRMG